MTQSGPHNHNGNLIRRYACAFVAFCLFSALLLGFIGAFISNGTSSKISRAENTAVVTDYHYYMILLSALATGEIDNPYAYSEQRTALETRLGITLNSVMPLGLSPSALVILRPLATVYQRAPLFSNTLWTYLSLALLVCGALALHNAFRRTFAPLFFLLLVAPFLLSYNFALNIFIGQTALAAAGCLLLLTVHASREGTNTTGLIVTVLCVAFLSIKITYLALAFSILLAAGRYRYAAASAAAVATLTAGAALLHGPAPIVSWVEQLLVFGSDTIPAHYQMAFNPETYLTLVSSLGTFAPPAHLNLLSKTLLVISVPLVILSARLGPADTITSGERDSRFALHIVLLFMLHLCCFPYLGGYEDLLIMVPILFVCMARQQPCGELALVVPLLITASLTSNKFFLVGHVPFWSLFAVKLGTFVVLLSLCRRRGFSLARQTVC